MPENCIMEINAIGILVAGVHNYIGSVHREVTFVKLGDMAMDSMTCPPSAMKPVR